MKTRESRYLRSIIFATCRSLKAARDDSNSGIRSPRTCPRRLGKVYGFGFRLPCEVRVAHVFCDGEVTFQGSKRKSWAFSTAFVNKLSICKRYRCRITALLGHRALLALIPIERLDSVFSDRMTLKINGEDSITMNKLILAFDIRLWRQMREAKKKGSKVHQMHRMVVALVLMRSEQERESARVVLLVPIFVNLSYLVIGFSSFVIVDL